MGFVIPNKIKDELNYDFRVEVQSDMSVAMWLLLLLLRMLPGYATR